MWSHTRYLECLTVAATIAPAELVRVATSFATSVATRGAAAARARLGVPAAYLAVGALALAVAAAGHFTPGYLTAWRADPRWLALAVAAGTALVAVEFAVGAVPKLLRGQRGLRLAVTAVTPLGAAYLGSIAVTAVAEEVLYRGLWIGVLHERLLLPSGVAIAFAAVAYALGHLFFGGPAVAQKAVSGAVFGLALVASGSLLVPLVAHLSQNLAVFALGTRGSRQAAAT
ncbi:CPBP family glutamic-type intramembrane protease [Kitasatospora sp. McL0602]|uniref:CPBP family glutamic-type intramembrane protease n=1 Tax=Kitasatospora sp. McL0602 TaxID=3439530 RepID=UPI003F89E686